MTEQLPLKSKAEIEIMRRASMIVFEVLQTLGELVKPGVTTWELNEKAGELTAKRGAKPAFLGYPSANKSVPPFPGVICASVNEVIVHGIPDKQPLKEGDILSIDYGCIHQGFFGDSAITVPVGKIRPLQCPGGFLFIQVQHGITLEYFTLVHFFHRSADLALP